ncbi:NAD(P)-binding protein [Aspergillus sclerotioniger CBS 115572]|uniref:NAD(P)-binding protein n=1 Tax=Aspergillus sclerotioniger CBS 115572 TaxID=1450535 RepID=A0A317X6Z4_9EURO|nr:NAD(P)-binding protein [Aspergillus sclerotioniger CBS 115572]PWY94353.1 NAD(P)-binding protein [Aspergillus sclerotioniger CBS 115572]
MGKPPQDMVIATAGLGADAPTSMCGYPIGWKSSSPEYHQEASAPTRPCTSPDTVPLYSSSPDEPCPLQATQNAIKSATPDANTRLLIMDLSSQESVRKAAEELNRYPEGIDRIIKSAGVMAAPYGVTWEGVEMQFRTNHVGHFLFTNLALQGMISQTASGMVRVVNVSSLEHKRGPVRFAIWSEQNGTYALFSIPGREGRWKGVESFSLYPGRVVTGIGRHLVPEVWIKAGWKHEDGSIVDDPKLNWRTPTQAAATLIVAAYDPIISNELAHVWLGEADTEPDTNGSYMVNNRVDNDAAADYELDLENAERLWKPSEEIVGQNFEYKMFVAC